MSPTAGTLYEYDLMLTTCQSAINAQFENLYDTPNPDDFTENLIPNTMKLGYTYYDEKTKDWKDTDEGLTADEIKSPTVDINSVSSEEGKNRAVRMSVKIVTGTMTYHDDKGSSHDVTVDGWTFSWIAGLGAKVIPNLDEAKRIHASAKASLKQALEKVPDSDFLPAAIFCTFESTTVAKTFKLYDKDGGDVSTSTEAAKFLAYFTTTYSRTDHLPWVLGYYVTQYIPHPDKTLPAFWPVKYWYSTTPYSKNADQATLNFCMLTSDSHEDTLVDPQKNPQAGIISSPFLDVTRADNLPSDGILAISSTTFYHHWLKPVVMDPLRYGYAMDAVKSTTAGGGSGQNYCSKRDEFDTGWHTHTKMPHHSRYGGKWPEDDTIVTTKTRKTGFLTASLTYSSTLQDKSSGTIPVDTIRQLTIKVKTHAETHIDGSTQNGLGESWHDWKEDHKDDFDASFTVSAGGEGSWVIKTSGDAWKILPDLAPSWMHLPPAHVMPNGDVFTFTGLDCDTTGNVYSHVKYKTIDGGGTSDTAKSSSSGGGGKEGKHILP